MKMRIRYSLLVSALLAGVAATSCLKESFDKPEGGEPGVTTDPSEIVGICEVDTRTPRASGSTKAMTEWALIDQVTTRQLDANFLRVDEEIGVGNAGLYTFYNSTAFRSGGNADEVNWEKGYLSEASVISSPDNTENIHYRSIIFSPRQAYNLYAVKENELDEQYDTTIFYHTRMVGWYPRNCALKVKDGTQRFENSVEQNETHEIEGRLFKAVKFTGLDGSKDVMVSNVCEGQHWHSANEGYSPHTNDPGNTPYRTPFGHYQSYNTANGTFTARYSNYFKFRHYLSGVRFWGFVPEQNSHALDMWGNITDVVLLNQPTSVCVTLPEEPAYDGNGRSLDWETEAAAFDNPARWGQAYNWGDLQNFSVQTGSMFGDDANHSDENFTVDFSKIDMNGIGDKEHAAYLGYSLVQPDHQVEVEIHTKYGVYVSTISPSYTYSYKDEHGVTQSETIDLFKPGYYYDVYLSLKTDGTISAIIEARGNERYFDLTHSVPVDELTGMVDESDAVAYRYSNCYIVDPADNTFDSNADNVCDYDGFFFSGLIAGNGSSGIFRYNSQEFYPSSADIKNPVTARLIWESSRLLISDVELINGYIKFKIPGIKDAGNYDGSGAYTGTKGNAVVGVFDSNDVCLWSWHIWITDKPQDITYTTASGSQITVLDRNLGATYGGVPTSAAQALETYGLYYQWGRKDPSIGPRTYNHGQFDSSTADYFDYASDLHTTSFPMSFNYPTLRDAVENPMNLILPVRKSDRGYDFDWLYIYPDNILWGHNHTTGNNSKTIYDPCPFGYRVSAGEISTIMEESTGYTRSTYGLSFTTRTSSRLFFPFAGYKGVDKSLSALTTAWSYVGKKGDYQEAVFNTSTSGGTLYYRKRNYISYDANWTENRVMNDQAYRYGTNISPVNGSYIYSDWTNRRTAASVRCVKDSDFGSIHMDINPAKTTFSAGDAVNVSFDVVAAASVLTNVRIKVSHRVDGNPVETVLVNTAPASSNYNFDYVFNAPDESYLETTDGLYVFTFSATNEFGMSQVETCTLEYKRSNLITMPASATLTVGGNADVHGTLEHSGTGQTITYSSSDEAVATVDPASGVVTGVSAGSAVITAHAAAVIGYNESSAVCAVTVKNQSVISAPASVSVGRGSNKNIGATINSGAQLSYVSDNTAVATVDELGNVTGVSAGTATITITAPATGSYTAPAPVDVTVNVAAKAPRTITLNVSATDLEVGGFTSGTSGVNTTIAPGRATLSISSAQSTEGAVTYTIVEGGSYGSVSGNVLTASAIGTLRIKASVAETGEYFSAESEPVEVSVYGYRRITSVTDFENGEYVIANGTSSSAYAIGWDSANNAAIQAYQLSSYGGTVSENVLSGIQRSCVVTMSGINSSAQSRQGTIKAYNGNYYLYVQRTGNNNNYQYSPKFTTTSSNTFSLGVTSAQDATYSRYLRYNSGWTTSGSSRTIYFYKRVCE